ncbi:MAG: MFS transporter [Nitrososphaerota archaeon]
MTTTYRMPEATARIVRRDLKASLRHWAALLIVLVGTFMVTLDFFIVNVAIPSLQQELHANSGEVQLVVAGYGLALAAGLITSGRLGDLYGRRRMFVLGLALFTLTSAACGLAPTPLSLVIVRVLQGVAAAILSPQVLAIVGAVYTGADRTRAFTVYGLALGIAAVGGQLIGGVLIQADVAGLGWRSCFLINVPVGIAALVLAPRLLPEALAKGSRTLDLIGAGLVTLALVAVVMPLILGRELGWPLWSWLSLAASLPLALAFVSYQRWLLTRNRAPLLDLSLFGERSFTVGLAATLVFFAGMASFFLVLALYLQEGRGLTALVAGITFSALGFGYLVASLFAGRLTRRLGRKMLSIGALVMALGLALMLLTVAEIGSSGSIAWLVPALLLDGAGMGLVLAPLSSLVLAGLPPQHAGAAAGVLATMQQVANALGVAIIGIIFYGSLGNGSHLSAYSHAFAASLVYLVALEVGVAVLIRFVPHDTHGQL